MSGNAPALLGAAAGVGFGHAILPDHWVPLAVLGRTRRYSLARVARLSGLAGVAHVLVSIVLGGVIIAIGLQFRSAIVEAHRLGREMRHAWLTRLLIRLSPPAKAEEARRMSGFALLERD